MRPSGFFHNIRAEEDQGSLRRIYNIACRMISAGRVWCWNQMEGVQIAKPDFVANSVRIQLQPDGIPVGGLINVGPGATISDGAILAPQGGSITIGRNVYIGPYAVLHGQGGLVIGDDVMIASHATIIPANHSFSSRDELIRMQRHSTLGIKILDDVWIGSGVSVLDGVTIGRGCVIGAGSVVTKSIPDYSVACGVPAEVMRTRGPSPPTCPETSPDQKE
jgi:acetyltransferase-like isoleucine patch superfamily enzyme